VVPVTAGDCNAWKGLVALDLVGQTDPDQHRMVTEHLAQCAECRLDVAALRPVDAALKAVGEARGDALLDAHGFSPERFPDPDDQVVVTRPTWGRKRRLAAYGLVGAAVAASIAAVLVFGHSTTPPARTVALTGEHGVTASASFVNQPWGTRVTLVESGQPAGEVLTVSMRTTSGHQWVAGSYRTSARAGALKVELSCPVSVGQITDVWVSDQQGRTVLRGYVS